jgi:hypothetical protein
MNTRQEYEDEQMRKYLTPELMEKAPTGFTDKVMNMVSAEASPVGISEKRSKRNPVPAISILVTLILSIAAFLVPASAYETTVPAWIKVARNFSISNPGFNLDSLLNFKLPAYLPYLFICLLFLTFFDRGLSGLFHRWKSHGSDKSEY